MATSENIIKRQSSTARTRVINNTWVDNTNIELIPKSGEFSALRNSTIRINQSIAIGKSAALVICAELSKIKSELNDLRDMNAKHSNRGAMESYDIRDFAESMFGFKKSQAYSYALVGERFLNDDGSFKREYVETLGACGASVLGLLTNMSDEDIIDMSVALDGKITAGNVREYRRALKSGNSEHSEKPAKTAETTDTPETPETTETTETTETAETTETPEPQETDENITFETKSTYHVVMEILDNNVVITLGDGDATRRRTYDRTTDKERLVSDLMSLI